MAARDVADVLTNPAVRLRSSSRRSTSASATSAEPSAKPPPKPPPKPPVKPPLKPPAGTPAVTDSPLTPDVTPAETPAETAAVTAAVTAAAPFIVGTECWLNRGGRRYSAIDSEQGSGCRRADRCDGGHQPVQGAAAIRNCLGAADQIT